MDFLIDDSFENGRPRIFEIHMAYQVSTPCIVWCGSLSGEEEIICKSDHFC